MMETPHEGAELAREQALPIIATNNAAGKVTGRIAFCCTAMKRAVADRDIPFSYYHKHRDYGIIYMSEGDWRAASWRATRFCPWCGRELPASVAEEALRERPDSDFWWEIAETAARLEETDSSRASVAPEPVSDATRELGFCCQAMRKNVDDPELPLVRMKKYDAFGLLKRDRRSWTRIRFCPWCGGQLPENAGIAAKESVWSDVSTHYQRKGPDFPGANPAWSWNHIDDAKSLFDEKGAHLGQIDPVFGQRVARPTPGRQRRKQIERRHFRAEREHCCPAMRDFLATGDGALFYEPRTRSYGLPLRSDDGYAPIAVCPWCGETLPADLRENLRRLCAKEGTNPDGGLERLPDSLRDDYWWHDEDLLPDDAFSARAKLAGVDYSLSHCCPPMSAAVFDARVPLVHLAKTREYAVLSPEGDSWTAIEHCPWCADEKSGFFWREVERHATAVETLRGGKRFRNLDILDIEETGIDFRLWFEPPMTPDDVTRVFGLKPSRANAAGNPLERRKVPNGMPRITPNPRRHSDWWLASNELIRSTDIGPHLAHMLALLEERRTAVRKLVADGAARAFSALTLAFPDDAEQRLDTGDLLRLLEIGNDETVVIHFYCRRPPARSDEERLESGLCGDREYPAQEIRIAYRMTQNGVERTPDGIPSELLRSAGTIDMITEYQDNRDRHLRGFLERLEPYRDVLERHLAEGCSGSVEIEMIGERNSGIDPSLEDVRAVARIAGQLALRFTCREEDHDNCWGRR